MRSSSGRLRNVLVKAAWMWVARDESARGRYRRLAAELPGEPYRAAV